MKTVYEEMTEEFQCPGCVCGNDIGCGSYEYHSVKKSCMGHVLGTHFGLGNIVALGLPKGFNKPGWDTDSNDRFHAGKCKNLMEIRFWADGEHPDWDDLNVPIWAMEKDGYLFVRTYCPRLNIGYVDVIKGGTLELCPRAIDVATIYDEID